MFEPELMSSSNHSPSVPPAAQQVPQEAPAQPGQQAVVGHAPYAVVVVHAGVHEVEVARVALVRERAQEQPAKRSQGLVLERGVACCSHALALRDQ